LSVHNATKKWQKEHPKGCQAQSENIAGGSLFSSRLLSNNLIISITTSRAAISWASAGKAGFRGSKNTPYAAQVAANDAAKTAYDAGLRSVEVFVKGPGSGREAAIRAV
jgi:ribosomal protein S11